MERSAVTGGVNRSLKDWGTLCLFFIPNGPNAPATAPLLPFARRPSGYYPTGGRRVREEGTANMRVFKHSIIILILTCPIWCGPGAAEAQESLAVRNARIYPVTGPVIPSGTLVVENGKISAIGPYVPVPRGVRIIDVEGKTVMPGIIENHSHMGMKRLWIPADLDNNELSGPINSQLRGIDSIDSTDKAFRIALAAGVTTMNVTPGSQTPNGGWAALLKLRGGTAGDMYYASGGHKMAIRTTFRERRIYPTTHMGVASILREHLVAAQEYMKAWEAYGNGTGGGSPPERNAKLESLARVLQREEVLGIHSTSPLGMQIAIRLAKEFDLDMFLIHASGLDHMVEETARSGYPISLGPCFPGMGREHRRWKAAVEFAELGGKLTLQQDHPDGPQYYIRHGAAMLVRHGMSEEEALKTITINSAEIFHLEDRIGSLEVGKDADFLVMSGEPLEIDTHVEQVFVEGKEVYNRLTGSCVFE